MSSFSLLGRTFAAGSLLHNLNSSIKLVAAIALMVIVLMSQHPLILLIMTVLTLGLIKLSKLPFSLVIKSVRPIIFIIIFAFLIHVLSGQGDAIVSFWVFNISLEGLVTGFLTALRITLLIINTSLFLTLTTPPTSLADGIGQLLTPLRRLRFPVHEFAMMMSIALRFIPILLEETDKIMKAQMARGADFESGGILKRAKSLIPLLVPLFVSAFRRANDLAMAMEARCYRGGDGRTKMKPLKYHVRDFVSYLVLLVYLAAIILSRILENVIF